MSRIFDALRKAEQEPSPLAEHEPAPLLGAGPHPRSRRTQEREFGTLSSAVQSYFPKMTTGKVVMVVGCAEREGATFVTSNLARTLAATSGEPVLCLDGDFHDQALSRQFQVVERAGITDVYGNGRPRDLSTILQPGDVGNLYVLGAGKRRVTPVAFFDSPEFDGVLAALRRTFRYVVLDSPPLLKHPDAIQLASRADGLILVVRYKRLKREVIRKGIDTLESINAPIIGAVLNRRKFAIPTLIYKLIS